MGNKQYWESVYSGKQQNEVSWYQQTPAVSLEFVRQMQIQRNSSVIDIGGGDSFFVDHLLALGFTDITVLDISEVAINKAKKTPAMIHTNTVPEALGMDSAVMTPISEDRLASSFVRAKTCAGQHEVGGIANVSKAITVAASSG